MKRFLFICFITSLLLFLASCAGAEPELTPTAHWTLIPTPTPQRAEAAETEEKSIDLSSPLFSLSPPEFIERYNAVYESEYGFTPLPAMDEWDELTPEEPLRLWRFAGDPKLSAEPSICIWARAESAAIERISLGFSDHGYTDENRESYEKLCLCAFLSAGLDRDTAGELFDTLFSLAMDESYTVADDAEMDIKTLYHDGSIGLYPWYSAGMVYIDMIPVSPESLAALGQSGAEIVDFRD